MIRVLRQAQDERGFGGGPSAISGDLAAISGDLAAISGDI